MRTGSTRLLLFACKRGRPRDLPLLREGARAAGVRFVVAVVPFAYPALLGAVVAKHLGADVSLVISDTFPGDGWFARRFGSSAVRMLWNYADEFPECLASPPARRVCFFEDTMHPVERFWFAPQTRLPRQTGIAHPHVAFMGDVSLDFELPRGVDWWRDALSELRREAGFGFYLTPAFTSLLAANTRSQAEVRQVRVFSKNLLRLWVVQSAHEAIGERLVLVGSNWSRFNLPSRSSAYSIDARLRLYQEATVNLDCGSKSGDSAIYPRSSEIISYAGAPVQVVCEDSKRVYGSRIGDFVFRTDDELHALLNQRLSESDANRAERTEWLSTHLEEQAFTMADSIRALLQPQREGSGC